jgi:hypothetical protein
MFDQIHVDERIFLITRVLERYILAEGKDAPLQTIAHKLYIPKVMFYAANARPRWDAERAWMFDGKVGMWLLQHKFLLQDQAGTDQLVPLSGSPIQ